MKKVRCLCCGYRTIDERGAFDICLVCFWEDEVYILFDKMDQTGEIDSIYNHNNCNDDDYSGEDILDVISSANHSLLILLTNSNKSKIYPSFVLG